MNDQVERDYAQHAIRWYSLRWLVRHFQGESIKHVQLKFALIECRQPWEDNPVEVELALLACVRVLNLWGPGTDGEMHPEVNLIGVQKRRVNRWTAEAMGNLYQRCRRRNVAAAEARQSNLHEVVEDLVAESAGGEW